MKLNGWLKRSQGRINRKERKEFATDASPSEPEAVATGQAAKLNVGASIPRLTFVVECVFGSPFTIMTVESVAGRYRSRF
jgi:hypothetical protein